MLKISREETGYLRCIEHYDLDIWLRGETMKRGETFMHHGSTLANDE